MIASGFRLSPQQRRAILLAADGYPVEEARLEIDIQGGLKPEDLEAALAAVAARHEILRTAFAHSAGRRLPLQAVAEPGTMGRFLDPPQAASVAGSSGGTESRPWHARLTQIAESRFLLSLRFSAPVTDPVSLGRLFGEIAEAYADPARQLEEPVQYLPYSEWQNELLESAEGSAAGPTPQPLPPEILAALGLRSGPGGSTRRHRPIRIGAAFCGSDSAPLLALFGLLVERLTGPQSAQAPPVGVVCDGRSAEEIAEIQGPIARAVPWHFAADPHESAAQGFERVHRSLEILAEAADTFAEAKPQPQLLGFQFADWPAPRSAGGCRFRCAELRAPVEPFALAVESWRTDRELQARLSWDPERCDPRQAELLASRFEALIEAAGERCRRIADLPLVTRAERHALVFESNDTARPAAGSESILSDLASVVRRWPTAVSVEGSGVSLSFAELADRALAWSRTFRDLGLAAEEPVAVCAVRRPELLAAILGILDAGGAFLPLDPRYPGDRLAFVLRDAGVRRLVADRSALGPWVPEGIETLVMEEGPGQAQPAATAELGASPLDPGRLAYVIYTSGSTGRPKGISIPHGALSNYLRFCLDRYPVGAGWGAPLPTPIGFDLGLTALFSPLLAGRRVLMVPDERDLDLLGAAARQDLPASFVKLTPAHFEAWTADLLDRPESDPRAGLTGRTRAVILGGEALHRSAVSPWLDRAPEVSVFNEYGPTEATVGAIVHQVRGDEEGDVPIGRPIANTRAVVLDSRGTPSPTGSIGRLFLGGAGLARGYFGRPDLTAERFLPDPFADPPGARLYDSGDLARRRADGVLEYCGRIDDQVKVRGVRIELGEIEAVLSEHPAVRRVAVVARRDEATGGIRLVAYWTADPPSPSRSEMAAFAARRLPEAMIPSQWIELPELPLSLHGKVDRAALPDPEREGSLAHAKKPGSLTEEIVAQIWGRVLDRTAASGDEDFIAAGGHSLLAMQLLSRVQRAFQVEIPVTGFFERPTVSGLAALIDAARATPVPRLPPLERTSDSGDDDDAVLTFGQERLWFLQQLAPADPTYNIALAARLEGDLDPRRLARAWTGVVARHEPLRTRFEEDANGRPSQRVLPQAHLPLPILDLAALAEHHRAPESRRLREAFARRPFALGRGPLLRLALVRHADREHQFHLVVHHAVCDGWSVGIAVREAAEIYSALAVGRSPQLPALPIRYRDFALWQRRALVGESLAGQLEFWRSALGTNPPPLELAGDRPRPEARSGRGSTLPAGISRQLGAQLRAFAREAGATPFMVLLAAFRALLARLAGRRDFAVGIPVAGRRQLATEPLVGFFVNTLALRLALASDLRFADLVAQTRAGVLAAHDHQDLPFERLVDELRPARSLARTPLFQAMLAYENTPRGSLDFSGLDLVPLPAPTGTAKFDLTLTLWEEGGDGWGAEMEIDADLFDPATGRRLVERFAQGLQSALAEPNRQIDDLLWIAPSERHQLLREWNDTAPSEPSPLLPAAFAAAVERAPAALAVSSESRCLSFAELSEQAERIARALRARGLRAEERVGLLFEREPEMLAALLGILQAGGCYVPLDPGHPEERLGFMLADSGARLVVVGARLDELASRLAVPRSTVGELLGASSADPLPDLAPDQLAYVMYTSGSTGRPKGVAVTHRGLANYLDWTSRAYWDGGSGGAPVHSSIAFDLTVTALLAPLVIGREVALMPEGPGLEPIEASRARGGWGLVKLTPAHLRALGAAGGEPTWAPSWSRRLVLGGEALLAGEIEGFRAAGLCLVNEYGPTEAVVGCATHTVGPETRHSGRVPIGRPIPGLRLSNLDAGRLVPIGAPGELAIGGVGLARGYLGRPDLTAERFVPDPFGREPGARLYRTGDLGRVRSDGELEYLGRTDEQVKIRGFRVEPGEIESVLKEHREVREAVAGVVGEPARLVAWFTAERQPGPAAESLRDHCRRHLPEPMVPTVFLALEAMPLSTNGKIDRRALPAPAEASATTFDSAPRDRTERLLAEIWQEVLHREPIGIHDNFFEIGGDSILSLQIVAHAQRAGLALAPRDLFRHQTVAELATVAGREVATDAEQGLVEGEAPLLPSQAWLFAQELPEIDHYAQSVLVALRQPASPGDLAAAVTTLVAHHDGLRLTFARNDHGLHQRFALPPTSVPTASIELRALPAARRRAEIERIAAASQAGFDLFRGPLFRALGFDLAGRGIDRLLLAAHHSAVDAVSWRILLADLERLLRGERLPAKTTSVRRWAELLLRRGQSLLATDIALWAPHGREGARLLPDAAQASCLVADSRAVQVELEEEATRALLSEARHAYRTSAEEMIVAALGRAVARAAGSRTLRFDLEGHGRDDETFEAVDLSRTVGWFTALYPVAFELDPQGDPGGDIRRVKEALRSVSSARFEHGMLCAAGRIERSSPAEIVVNYLGRLDLALEEGSRFAAAEEAVGPSRAASQRRPYPIEINAGIYDGRLRAEWVYDAAWGEGVANAAAYFHAELKTLIAHCLSPSGGDATPSDFRSVALSPAELDDIASELGLDDLEDA